MQTTASPFSRVLALLGLLLVAITMVGSGMSMEDGVWQKALPISILAGGAVLVVQFISLLANGASGIPANIVWRFAGAFGFFVGTFSLLGVIFPDTMWEITKGTATLPPGIAAGVDPKLQQYADISGPFSPALLLVVNAVLIAVAFLGTLTEDGNPEMEPVH